MARLEGWETRLAAAIEDARREPYELGVNDCFRLACSVVHALTGVDRWSTFAGSYRTKREALVRIMEHGRSFESAGDWFFGTPHVNVNFARRGDIIAYADPTREKHLAVCLGARAAVLADVPRGMILVPIDRGICAWRVG